MGWPERQAVIAPLATNSKHNVGKIENVELLGFRGKLQWKQGETGFIVQLPDERPSDHAVAFKITGA
jgi:alpha-L-fucosidase